MSDNKNQSRLLLMLGLCRKAGKLVWGTDNICTALRESRGSKRPLLVLEAEDTSANTHKKLSDKCSFYKVEHIVIKHSAAELGGALGCSNVCAAAAVTDAGFCEAINKMIAESVNDGE